ncbi:MAG TPA: AsmA family protein, partial [Chitinophagaceae bacterium]|nr:AsmA family protein [Chitinophagaceae bacterium]
MLKKFEKYAVRGIGIFFLLLLLYWTGIFIFFQVKKESIRKQLSEQVSEVVKGEFTIRDLGVNFFSTFPNIALSMKDVLLKDSAWKTHQIDFLKAKKILFRINPFSLIGGNVRISKIVVEDGVVQAFTNSQGYTNEYLLSPKSKSNGKSKNNKKGFHVEEITLKDVRVIRSDEIKKKLFDISFRKLKCELNDITKGYLFEMKMDAAVSQMAFNTNKGSYLQGKNLSGEFDLRFDTTTKTLHFEKIRLNADRQRLILSGNFQFGTEKKFTLQVNGDKLQYSKGIALLPKKITDKLALYDINVPMNVTADIEGGLVFGAATKVKVQSTVNNATVKTDAGDFTNSDFHVE